MLRYLSSYIWTDVAMTPAAGRNMPTGFKLALQEAKFKLDTVAVDRMVPLNRTEVDVVRSNLRPTQTKPPLTEYPCTNPLFKELRLRRPVFG